MTSRGLRTGEPGFEPRLDDSAAQRAKAWLPVVVLLVLVVLLYLPSLGGGFLNLDDPWLIEQNPIFRAHGAGALHAIWTDFSPSTRLALGAEYLPVRDTTVWLDSVFDGLSPLIMRATDLSLYLGALVFLRAALRRALGATLAVELSIFVFALHPVHVESVAWLAGRKDVLALFFVTWALFVHAGESRLRPVWVPLLLMFAYFSKAQSVIAVGLLAAHDVLARRRPDLRVYVPTLLSAALAALLHAEVGHRVHMLAKLAGGTRVTAFFTMGEITSRYLANLLYPFHLSVLYDAPAAVHLSVLAGLGYGALLVWAALGLYWFRRGGTSLVLSAWLWFVLPLLPVSQVIFPLQNRMADRYLLFSVLSLGLLVAAAWQAARGRLRAVVATLSAVGLTVFAALTLARSDLFADSARLFADATRKTESNALAPYQWGIALEAESDFGAAEQAYQETLLRIPQTTEPARRASNNLARLYARDGKLVEAERVLVRGRRLWPRDPKLLYNLAVVTARRGDEAQARSLVAELHERFPAFRPGQSSAADFYQAE